MAKNKKEWLGNLTLYWSIATVIISFLFTFFLAVFSFCIYMLIQRGIDFKSLEYAGKFIKKSFLEPFSLSHLYSKWFSQITSYGGPFNFDLWIPLIPLIAFFIFMFVGLRAKTKEIRVLETVQNEERRTRILNDFLANLENLQKLDTDSFEEKVRQMFGHTESSPAPKQDKEEKEEDQEEETYSSPVFKTLYSDESMTIVGKEGCHSDWENKVRLVIVKCEKSMANGFFIKNFYENKLKDKACRNVRGFFKDMTDMQANEDMKQIKNGTLDITPYVPIMTWEKHTASWKKAKVIFCMLVIPI